MGNLIFCGLHILALVFGAAGLIITIPLHLIYSAANRRGQSEPTPTARTHVRCPACRELVRRDAMKCKHCGVRLEPSPQKTMSAGNVLAWVAVGAILLAVLSAGRNDAVKNPHAVETKAAVESKTCDQAADVWCAIEASGARYDCLQAVDGSARYGFRWADGWLEAKFSRAGWLDKDAGTIALMGDAAEFQNASGAYVLHHYTCEYSLKTKKVMHAYSGPGRLPQPKK